MKVSAEVRGRLSGLDSRHILAFQKGGSAGNVGKNSKYGQRHKAGAKRHEVQEMRHTIEENWHEVASKWHKFEVK